ncbi:MAG: pectate lyase [Bacteroidales bacterium]
MGHLKNALLLLVVSGISVLNFGQNRNLSADVEKAMLKATQFMVEEVSYNGGYLWYYLPDFSRQWGEMEAYPTMIWVQSPGSVSMGNTFLDAYHATGNEYYYSAAEKVAAALIWGQQKEGGWNYMIDFAGDRSLKQWYNTIGKNGWRLEEFQHYYGNSTFDDGVSSGVARFLLRIYLEKMDPKYRPPLDRAIAFILESQYPLGGWPQRYPLKHDFSKNGRPDYSSFYTFNDAVIEANINFLILCYLTLGKQEYLDPIRRGMNCYLIFQSGNGGWGQQYNEDLEPAGARSYEPDALLPSTTFQNAMSLLDFYELTGERKYLDHVPLAISFLEETRLPDSLTDGGRYTHPAFLEPGTNKPIYVHRTGSNVIYGHYYVDENDHMLLGHYGGKRNIPVDLLQKRYDSLATLDPVLVARDSPLKPSMFSNAETPQKFFMQQSDQMFYWFPQNFDAREILESLDEQGRWLTTRGMTSHPYIGDGINEESTETFAGTDVGDDTDTSPFRDTTGQEYISTGLYMRNMRILMDYLNKQSN